MKSRRIFTAVAIAVVMSVNAPEVSARPHDGGRDLPRLVKVIKKFQQLFGIASHDEQLQPPRP